MTRDGLIAAAQTALGGLGRLLAVRSYHARLLRTNGSDGRQSAITIWRAAGGRVRVEEETEGVRTVRSTGGAAGPAAEAERADLLREARIAPRNMLAHAAEHRLSLRSNSAPDGSFVLSMPRDFTIYLIDPASFLCTRMIDIMKDHRVEFGDFRAVDGIATPFFEHHSRRSSPETFEDVYLHVAYDVEPPEGTFD